MCDLRMFSRALLFFEMALNTFKNNPDEDNLAFSGYLIQQTVEFVLKGFLNFTSSEVPKTHSIKTLINMSDNSKSKCEISQWIREHKDTLTLWESKGRYPSDEKFEFSDIKDALFNVKAFLINNGVTPKLLPEVTEDIKISLKKSIPLDDIPTRDLDWNILYRLYYTVQSKEYKFDLDKYFEAAGVIDKQTEINRLKKIYNTDDMSKIRQYAEKLYNVLTDK